MSHKHSKHVSEDEKLHIFYIKFDLDDKGKYVQNKEDFYNELFNDITAFAFGSKRVMERIKCPQDIAKVQREALQKMYSIPEIKKAREYYSDKNSVEDKYLRRGEFGELILYHLLNEYFKADSLISKIYFKDSTGVPPHGFDAVHVDSENKTLWVGESKLYKSGSNAMDALISDLNEHFKVDFFKEEFTVITNRVQDSNVEVDEFISKLIDPETKILDKLANINIALFAGFDSQAMGKGEQSENFSADLEKEIEKLRIKIDKKSSEHPWNENLNIYLFLFPLVSKREFVSDLHNKLQGAQQL